MNDTNLKNVRAIFFDLDNTLIPTRSGDVKACRKISESLQINYEFTEEEAEQSTQCFLKSFRSCPDNPSVNLDEWRIHLWKLSLPEHFRQYSSEIYQEWLKLRYFYLSIPVEYQTLLKRFRSAGYTLCLITNGPTNAQWEKVHKLNVSQFFDCILVSSDLPWEKPDPNIFYAACNYLGLKPSECVMIGDKIGTDVKGGNAANLGATFWIPLTADKLHTYHAEVDHIPIADRPHYIVEHLLDLYKYFPSCRQVATDTDNNQNSFHRRNSSSHMITSRNMQFHQKRVSSLPEFDYYCSENSSDSCF